MKYDNARNIFQQKVNSVLNKEAVHSNLFEDIFKLQQILSFQRNSIPTKKDDADQWTVLLDLFLELGTEQFAKIVTIMRGKTVTFPSEEEYKDSILTTLCYYYKEIENLKWNEIKDKLNMKQLNAIKYGISVRQLKAFIDSQILKEIRKED